VIVLAGAGVAVKVNKPFVLGSDGEPEPTIVTVGVPVVALSV
jgi:hypothetical protein